MIDSSSAPPAPEAIVFMPLDLDTFVGSERFMDGSELGTAFGQGMRAYLHAQYSEAVERFKAALIAAYVDGGQRAIISDRERAIIYLYIGNAWGFAEDWPAALREYLEAVRTDPSLSEAHYNLGVAFAASGQTDRAIAAFKEALEHNDGLYEAHFALARCYQHLGDSVRAYIHYASAREVRPQAGEPLYYMGLMHQRHGAHELAQRCFADALRVEPTFISPESDPQELVHKTDTDTAQWYYRLSDDLKNQGAEEEAERIYRALLEWRPDEHRARYLLGNLLARRRRWEEAVREYLSVPPSDPFYVVARLRIATVLRLGKRLKQAYSILFECARQRPNEGQLYVHMGKLLYDLEKPRAAARALEHATHLMPNDSLAFYLLGFMYLVIGKESWTIAAWCRAVTISPRAASLRYDLACIYLRRGDHELAAAELEAVVEHKPEDIEAAFLLGTCYKELHDPVRAIPLFELVVKHQPNHVQALYFLGACYLQTGNTPVGRAYLRRYDRLLARGGRAARLPHQVMPPGS
jgi:tetratricopeptide (TPR) repeat protein